MKIPKSSHQNDRTHLCIRSMVLGCRARAQKRST
jgi:hypothetical protein